MTVTASPFSCFIIGETTLSIRCAELLQRGAHQILGIVSDNPDVTRWAAAKSLPVIDPQTDFASVLLATPHDYLFSIVNGRLLPSSVTQAPRRLTINYHDAPLPAYAGMHATSWALMNQESMHGISWHVATEEVDAGDIVCQQMVTIDADDTALSLNAKCYEAAAEAFAQMVDTLASGAVRPQPQDLSRRSYFGRYRRPPGAALLDWRKPAAELSALVRSLDFGPYPNPLARPKILLPDGSVCTCTSLVGSGDGSVAAAGTVTDVGPDSLSVASADGVVVVRGLQLLTSDGHPDLAASGVAPGVVLPAPADELVQRIAALDEVAPKAETFWRRRLESVRPAKLPWASAQASPAEVPSGSVCFELPVVFRGSAGQESALRGPSALLAALTVYLSRLTREAEIDLGFRRDADSDPVDRLYASVVPIRLRMDPQATFAAMVDAAGAELDRVQRACTFPRDLISRYPSLRARGGPPRYPVQIHLATLASAPGVDDEEWDLAFAMDAAGDRCTLSFRGTAVSARDAHRIADQLGTLLASAAASPDAGVSALALVPPDELHTLLTEWNDTAAEYPRDSTVHALIEARVREAPSALAVVARDATLTFAELDARAEVVASDLRSLGIGAGTLVGVCAGRSAALVVSLLGVLKAGAAYVPLDGAYPADRLRFMIEDAGLDVFVVERGHTSLPMPVHAAVLSLHRDGTVAEREAGRRTAAAGPAEPRPAGPDDIAYVIYTSGSTGRPKGAMLPHRGVVNYLTWSAKAYECGAGAGSPVHSSPAFDLTVTSLYTPLVTGRPVHLVDEQLGPEGLATTLRQGNGFSLVKITPAHLDLLRHQLTPAQAAEATRFFVIGGENLLGDALDFWRRHAPSTALINEYGPTETVVGCCVYRVRADDRFKGAVPIGKPIANTRLYVVDAYGGILPIGVPGELCIAGDCVGAGYLNRPELTAERFRPDPFGKDPGARLYRTGDLVRHLANGDLEFLGRLDDQVKIRGFRIELGEIEAVLTTLPKVRSAAVAVREPRPGDQRLIGYYTVESGATVDEPVLRAGLQRLLPDYMVPSQLIQLEALPLTQNGKIDRRALPAPRPDGRGAGGEQQARNPLEAAIAEVWCEELGIEQLGRGDDFFDMGGHSLLVQSVRQKIEQRTGLTVSALDIFRNRTVAALAELLSSQERGERVVTGDRPVSRTDTWSGRFGLVARRFLVPQFVASLYYYLRFGAKVSPRAEVELSPLLSFGRGTSVGSFAKIKATHGPVRFGERCGIANFCFISGGEAGLIVGDNFTCGPHVTITSSSYLYDEIDKHIWDQGQRSLGVRIGHNVRLGAGVTVLDGVELGDNTIVVANSVVDRKHPAGVILRGNPAEVVLRR